MPIIKEIEEGRVGKGLFCNASPEMSDTGNGLKNIFVASCVLSSKTLLAQKLLFLHIFIADLLFYSRVDYRSKLPQR
jgi:hypothetical protein